MGQKTLYNRGQRTFVTAAGKIEPGKTVTVSDEEAKLLEGYPDLVEFSKLNVAGSNELKELKLENQKLKAEVERLQGELSKTNGTEPEVETPAEPEAPETSKGRSTKTKGKK